MQTVETLKKEIEDKTLDSLFHEFHLTLDEMRKGLDKSFPMNINANKLFQKRTEHKLQLSN